MTNIHVVTILAIVLSSTANGQDGTRLLYQMPAKSQYSFSINNNSLQSSLGAGQESSVNVLLDMVVNLRVKDVVLNRSTIELRVDSTNVRRGSNSPAFRISALENVRFDVTITPDGTLLGKDLDDQDTTMEELGKVLEAYRLLDWIFTPFPRHDVQRGEKWTVNRVDTTVLSFGPVVNSVTIQYTLASQVDTLGLKCWRIDFESTDYTLSGDISGTGFVARFDGDGRIDGRAYHEVQTGAPVMAMIETNTNSKVQFVNPNVVIPVVSTLRSHITRRRQSGR
jgi:hypothetical protein